MDSESKTAASVMGWILAGSMLALIVVVIVALIIKIGRWAIGG